MVRPSAPHRSRSSAAALYDRRLRLALVGLAVAVPLVVGAFAALRGWKATGDNALISIRVGDVLRGDLPTSGLPTTGENFGSGVASNHPGPMQFYVLAPFQALYGIDVGLALGAAFVNAVAWGLAVWASTRRLGPVAGAVTLGIYGLLAFGLGAHLLYDPVSSNIATFASVTAVILAASLLDGDWGLAPAFVLVASFVVQAHLTYVALGVPVVLVVFGALGLQIGRRQPLPVARLVQAGILGLVLWAPVVIDQFFGTGNVGNVIRTFSEGKTVGSGFGFAFGRLWYAIAPIPMFARRIEGLGFLTRVGTGTIVLGLAVVAAFGACGWWCRRHRPELQSLVGLVGLVMLTSVYSASKLPSAATVKAANLRWMWTGGALVWLVLVLAVAELAGRRWRRADVFSAVACLAVLASVAGVASFWMAPPRDDAAFDAIAHLRVDTRGELPKGRYVVRYEGNEALLTLGPAIVADLIAEGYDAKVDLGPFNRAYGDHTVGRRAGKGREVLIISAAKVGSEEEARAAALPADAVVASNRFSPGPGEPDVVVRVIRADLATACGRLRDLVDALTGGGGKTVTAERLDELLDPAEATLGLVTPVLSRPDRDDLRTLLAVIRGWQQQLAGGAGGSLEELARRDVALVAPGLQVVDRRCPGS